MFTKVLQLGCSGRHCTLASLPPVSLSSFVPQKLCTCCSHPTTWKSHAPVFTWRFLPATVISIVQCHLRRACFADCTVPPYYSPAYHFIFFVVVAFGITCNFSVSLHLYSLFLSGLDLMKAEILSFSHKIMPDAL